jgi:hypothetical protein
MRELVLAEVEFLQFVEAGSDGIDPNISDLVAFQTEICKVLELGNDLKVSVFHFTVHYK